MPEKKTRTPDPKADRPSREDATPEGAQPRAMSRQKGTSVTLLFLNFSSVKDPRERTKEKEREVFSPRYLSLTRNTRYKTATSSPKPNSRGTCDATQISSSFGARLIQSTNLRVILNLWRIMWYQSHSEVQSSSQLAILKSSSSKRSSLSFGLLKRNHEETPTILNSSSSNRSPVFGLLINHEVKAARKAQEDKLQEWRYNKRTVEMIAEYERGQEKKAKKSRPERDKWKKPVNKEATQSYLRSRSNEVKPSSPKKAVQKPQSKLVVETPSTRTEEKRNKGFEKWLESFKARIHQSITNPCPSSVFEEDHEAKDIEPELSTVYVRAKSKDDLGPIFDEEEEPFGQWTMDDDFDPIFDEEDDHLDDDLGPIFDEEDDHLDDDYGLFFDEEEEPEAVSVFLAVQKVAEDVVDSGPEADHENDLTTTYASGGETCDQSNNNQSLAKKIAKVELKNVGSFILEGLNFRTNSCKGGGDDATQISRYVSTRSLRYEPVKQLIIAWLNEHFMGLIGLIHEVLDREKLMGLMQNGEALCSIRNQCLDLSKKCPPRKYKPWSYNISI
ncbi:hypothetical protein DY000_02024066 [Brassica cretica]|uniref:Calponin-homology (CH) domain-containing protein n=1 Tax=Brassica cretica TaxID=69181 RepID=A0ABQ7E784_BRACR|nr:hypothetical protein DY000_02024066 [Brassica cretica]